VNVEAEDWGAGGGGGGHQGKEPGELWSSFRPDGKRREDLKEEVVCLVQKVLCIIENTTVCVIDIFWRWIRAENFEN
jgi:hypothetical protein